MLDQLASLQFSLVHGIKTKCPAKLIQACTYKPDFTHSV